MKALKGIFLGILPLLVGFVPLQVAAGVRMVMEHEDAKKEVMTHTILIEKDRIRTDFKDKETDGSIIFRTDKEVFWFLDHKEKSYTEITRKDMEEMRKKMEEAMKMMEEQMKHLSPEQRKKMEEMLKGEREVKTPQIIYKKVASGQKVNQWICDKYEGFEGKKKVEDVWTTDWRKLGLKPEDLKIMDEMGKFFSEMAKGISNPFYKIGPEKVEKEGELYSGIPIKTIGYEDGKVEFKAELKEIKKESFKPSLFELPKGYKKEKFGEE